MSTLELIEDSISILRTNRLRTGLSILGIIIGIGSVITLLNLGQASQAAIKSRIQSLGSNILTIRPGAMQQGPVRDVQGSGSTLKLEDAQAIESSNRFTSIDKVASEYSVRSQIVSDENNANLQVSGVSSQYFAIRNIEVETGSLISEDNIKDQDKVALLGSSAAKSLFTATLDPIGKEIRIKGVTFKVIGVTKAKGLGFNSPDESIIIPVTTAQRAVFGVNYLTSIYVSAKDESQMDAALNQIGFFLLERHGKTKIEDADFNIQSQSNILETVNQVTDTFTSLLSGIAAISLIVGGIGIMNIMLVTVTERTSEIGLRKALGAKRKVIIKQFLIEAILLTITGGLIGVLVGLGILFIITKLMSLNFIIDYNSIVLSVIVSLAVGVLFGWYPAYKASKLQPIDALRYE